MLARDESRLESAREEVRRRRRCRHGRDGCHDPRASRWRLKRPKSGNSEPRGDRPEASGDAAQLVLARRSFVQLDGIDYAPITDYAAIGDGRTVALVALDGSIDWLCLPDIDSPSAFGALLDANRGGSFRLAPVGPFSSERRYLPGTNLLETVFRTSRGAVRITDCMNLPLGGLAPSRELARRIEGLSGEVSMSWTADPRFDFAQRRTRTRWRGPMPVATDGSLALGFSSWSAGEPRIEGGAVSASFSVQTGEEALLVLSAARGEPWSFQLAKKAKPGCVRARATGASGRRVALRRSLARCGPAERAGAETADLRAFWGDHGGGDELAARGDRRSPQLGLPVLLDPGCLGDPRSAAGARLLA